MGNPCAIVLTKQLESAVVKCDPWHRLLYGRVRRATAISTMIRGNLAATTPLRPEQIDLVHLGIDTGRFAPDRQARLETRRELGVPGKFLAIGMMGRMSPGKGYDDFIGMAAQLDGADLRFVLIGGHSRKEDAFGDSIEAKARTMLGPRVSLTGHREDRQRWLNALDIFVFPSHAESFGLALVEAMATGLSCAAYGAGGVLDIVDHGKDGLLAEVKNISDLRATVEQLIRDPVQRTALGNAARAKAVELFSEQRMLAGTMRTYERALA